MREAKLDLANHPCFNPDVYRKAARIHLPVAPKCNLQCNYCDRSFDCANETRPGVSSVLLSPFQAVTYLKAVYAKMPQLTVVGIAGPGDPFANPVETMETLRLVREEFPNILLCVATNGLGLVEHIDELVELKVSHVTMTINTVNPAVGAKIYRWVRFGDLVYRGVQGAELLLARQREALERLRQTKILVKVNTIVLPGINEGEIAAVAAEVRASGAEIMNTMAMVPVAGTPFESLGEPPPTMMAAARLTAGKLLPQMSHCARCRADACGFIGEASEGMPDPKEFALLASRPGKNRPYVAVASREGMLVNQHVGEATCFHVFAESRGEPAGFAGREPSREGMETLPGFPCQSRGEPAGFAGREPSREGMETLSGFPYQQNMTYVPVDIREAPDSGSGVKRWLDLADLLGDCRAVLTTGVGAAPRRVLTGSGLEVIEMEGLIEEGLAAIFGGAPIPASLRRKFGGCGLGCSGGGGGCG